LKVNDENRRIRIRILIRIHESEAWIRGSGSTPKCHGSATLVWRLIRNRFTYNISLVVLSARSRLSAWMHWSKIDVIVLGFKSIEKLYPSPGSPNCPRRKLYIEIPILPNNPARQ
jgi:hypothetical protein